MIVALSPAWGHNNHCGQTVNIHNPANGRSISAVVADTCPGCEQTKLDLSVGAYEALTGGLSLNPFNIDWYIPLLCPVLTVALLTWIGTSTRLVLLGAAVNHRACLEKNGGVNIKSASVWW